MSAALFLGTSEDSAYTELLKGLFNAVNPYLITKPVTMLAQLEMVCKKLNITRIASTNTDILKKLLELRGNTRTDPKLSEYAGSLFTYKGIEIVFIHPLKHLQSVTYGKFLAKKFISKIVDKEAWAETTKFDYTLARPENIASLYEEFKNAYAIATDIETFKNPLSIRCIGYTGLFINPGTGDLYTRTFVLPITDTFALSWMRKINTLPAQKIFQRGKYDNSYLLRFNAAPSNWLWDTANLFHCQYSELPKDLAFLNAFYMREVVYWKDLAETSDLQEYYRYCGLDTHATCNVWIRQMLELPDWAKRNYILEFPLNYPCILAEMTGVKRDPIRHVENRKKVLIKEQEQTESLRRMIGCPDFNPGSSKQVMQLVNILGNKRADGKPIIQSTEESDLKKLMFLHPLVDRILGTIPKARGYKKVRTTYLRTDEDITKTSKTGPKEFFGRILYALNPDATDSGRLASKEHHFWCGVNIQNQPTDDEDNEINYVKNTIVADEGFYFGEADLKQAESRDTANLLGDEKLIGVLDSDKDFHSWNGHCFFGIPYEDLWDSVKQKSKNKLLRLIFKRVNHGATYNMEEYMLLDTMGSKEVLAAKKLLNLPFSDLQDVTKHLLIRFHQTYPKIKGHTYTKRTNVLSYNKLPQSEYKLFAPGTYYAKIVEEVLTTNKIVSRAYHHTEYNKKTYPDAKQYIEELGDWTRYCFGKPKDNKLDLNSYVSHPPQSLNSRTLNEAWMEVFYNVALPNPDTFRLHAQIHDSIFFSYKNGYERHAEEVKRCMEIPVTVRDIEGKFRTFTVPADLKLGRTNSQGELQRATYWDETE